MNVNYEYYRTFYYVAKYGSITKAASVLCSEQPNITRALNKLEEQLGCTLFIRNRKGVTLTPEGERLFAHVEIAIMHFQQAENELSADAGLSTGSISLGASETALNLLLLDRLAEFRLRYPGIRLRIINGPTPLALKNLELGAVDMAIVTTPLSADRQFKRKTLMNFREIPVCGKRFRSLASHTMSLREMTNYPLVMLGSNTMTRAYYNEIFSNRGLALSSDTEMATADQLLPAIRSGLGIGFIPEEMAGQALEKGEIFRITLNEELPERSVVLVSDSRRPLSIAAGELERYLNS